MKKLVLSVLFIFSTYFFFAQSWHELQKLVVGNESDPSQFGCSVSISGDYAIIGDCLDSEIGTQAGAAYIFYNNNGLWQLQSKILPAEGHVGDWFGYSVGISGNYAIVGARREEWYDQNHYHRTGVAYIYYNNNGNWELTDRITPSEYSIGLFGSTVSISGDQAVIIDYNGIAQMGYPGVAYFYKNIQGQWIQEAYMSPSDGFQTDGFGCSASISGNYAVIGAFADDDLGEYSGSAYVYQKVDGVWVQSTKLTASSGLANDNFGYSVCIYQNRILIGAPNSGIYGEAFLFTNNNDIWEEESIFMPSDNPVNHSFGSYVCLNDEYAIISNPSSWLGKVYIYVNTGEAYVFKEKIIPWNPEDCGDFGRSSVSISDNFIIVGAPKVFSDGRSSAFIFKNKGASGAMYFDIDEDCTYDTDEMGLNGRIATINPGDYVVETGINGFWHIDSLPAGDYTITADTSGKWIPTCPVSQNFTVVHSDSVTVAPSFGFVSTETCADPSVSVTMPNIRRCFSNQKIYVNACNTNLATRVLNNAYVELELDSLLTPTEASIPYTYIGENAYRFNLGSLNPGMCKSFWMNTNVSCDAIIGQTFCTEAKLFPADSCVFDTLPTPGPIPCNEPWDRSSLSVEGWCQNDSVYFTVTNTGEPGEGDMVCWSAVRIFIDGELFLSDSVQLAGSETQYFIFSGDGRTWRLEADQHPLHPGNSHPNATVELCGNPSNWTPGLVTIMPQDDADPVIDIYCGRVTGSYDPNDKAGVPKGIGMEHHILPNSKIEYTIRFQNTGTDTAFTVIIRDTLDTDLDIFSVHPGASSHECNFRMFGPRVIEWSFYHILLPDSNVNEPESHGFVSFTVDQLKDLPDGTQITNNAGIWFDFNEPVITNTVTNVVNRDINTQTWLEEITLNLEECAHYSYNGITYNKSGTYYQIIDGGSNPDTLLTLNLTLIGGASVTVDQYTITADLENAEYQWVDCDNEYAWIAGETGQSFTAIKSGNYAVIVTQYACADTSECVNISFIDVNDIQSGNLKIYPNPTQGIFTLQTGCMNYPEFAIYSIKDITGKILKEGKTFSDNTEIDLSRYSKGIYMIQVQTANQVFVAKIIKD